MKNTVLRTEERQFITKEFTDTIAGETPPPYLRLHDSVQNALTKFAASESARQAGRSAYSERMIRGFNSLPLKDVLQIQQEAIGELR